MDSQNSNNSNSDLFEDFELPLEELNDINDDYEYLRSIFEVVLCTTSTEDVEESVFKAEMPKLKSTCVAVFTRIKDFLNSNNKNNISEVKHLLQVYTKLLNLCHTAIRFVKDKALFVNVFSLPMTTSEILLDTFTHCKESEKIYGSLFEVLSNLLSTLFKKAGDLQNDFLNLINKLLIYDLTNKSELQSLVEVAGVISCIGEAVSDLDLKTSVETWKGYITLTNLHCDHLKESLDITSPLKYLTSEIIQNLQKIVLEDDDDKTRDKLLKVSNFYLKTLVKLCELFVDSFNVHYNLFELLIILHQYSFSYLKWKNYEDKLADSIQMYITTGADPLLNILFEDRMFVRCYFKNITAQIQDDERRLGAIFLSTSIIKKAMYTTPEIYSMWFSADADSNIIYSLFSFTDVSHVELSSEIPIVIPTLPGAPRRIGTMYEFLLMHIGSAIISLKETHAKTMQEFMLGNILQPSPWKALFTIDLWCIVARYGSEDFCYNQLLFLLEIYSDLRYYKHKLEVKFLGNLIKRLYKLLSTNNILSLSRDYPCLEYPYVWIIIGLDNHSENITDTICSTVLLQIDLILKNSGDVEKYSRLCDLLELLSTHSFPEVISNNIKKLLPKIVLLWSLNFDEIKKKYWITSFVNVLSKITASVVKYLSNVQLMEILCNINRLDSTDIAVRLAIILIVHALGSKYIENTSEQKHIFILIKSLLKVLLKDDQSVVKQEAMEAFSFFAYNTQHESIIKDIVGSDDKIRQEFSNYIQNNANKQSINDYLMKQRNSLLNHKCVMSAELTEPLQKKQKTSRDIDIVALIQRLKLDCNSLAEYCETEPLTPEIKTELFPTVTKLLPFLEK